MGIHITAFKIMSSQLLWHWKPGQRHFQNVSDLAQLQSLLQTPGYQPQGR